MSGAKALVGSNGVQAQPSLLSTSTPPCASCQALMAPYMRPLTDLVVAYIENEGIEVIDSMCFEIPDNLEVGLRDPMQLVNDVRGLNTEGADVVVASACVQMPSLPAIQRIEDMLGIRTVSTA